MCFRRSVEIIQGLLLPLFQFRLALMRGLGRVGTGLDPSLLDEVSPTGVAVFGGLAALVLLGSGLCGILTPRDLNYSSGLVGANVVADDGVRR